MTNDNDSKKMMFNMMICNVLRIKISPYNYLNEYPI